MNRVVMNMDEQGCWTIYSDEPIEFFVVNDHCPADRVYQQEVEVGVEKVREQLGSDMIGHMGDSFFETRTNFGKRPPNIIAQFTERVPMVKGRLTATGSTATAYCWLVWVKGRDDTRFVWIPPCRKNLERAEDYRDAA